MGLASVGGLGVDDYQVLVPGGQYIGPAGDGGAGQLQAELVLAFHGYQVASVRVFLGAEAQQLGVPQVVPGLVEAAFELIPSPAVVVGLEPDFELAQVQAHQELGEPGRVDIGAVFSESRQVSRAAE